MTTIIFGAIPPPLGGVSTYVYRRINLLKLENANFLFLDSRYKTSLIKLFYIYFFSLFSKNKVTIELNVSNKFVLFAMLIFGMASSSVFVDHNGSRRLLKSKLGKFALDNFSRHSKFVWPVNIELYNYYKSIGIQEKKIKLITPYLKPTEEEVQKAILNFPSEYDFLLNNRQRNIILASAWKTASSESEYDLYGLLDVLNVYQIMAEKHPNFYFVLMLGVITNDEFGLLIESRINEVSRFKNIIIIKEGVSQLSVLDNTKALLRLTKTDGDSVSVREALDFGANVIASDVCPRPSGVILVSLEHIDRTVNILENLIMDRL